MQPQDNHSGQTYGTMANTTDEDRNTSESNGQIEGVADNHKAGSSGRGLKQRLSEDVDPSWADLILIVCFFISGLIDSTVFNTYSCFASMQTGRPQSLFNHLQDTCTDSNPPGNTIFVGLGVTGQPAGGPEHGWAKSLTAICSFILGAFFFSTYHRLLSPGTGLRRAVLISSFLLQALLIMITAILATTGVIYNKHGDGESSKAFDATGLAPLALLAFQSAGQVVASRALKYNELPTVVLTSLMADLMSDAHLLTAGLFDDPKRNRRVMGIVFLLGGAICGGVFTQGWVGLAGALWIAAILKFVMVFAWAIWSPKPKEGEQDGQA